MASTAKVLAEPLENGTLQTHNSLLLPLRNPHHGEAACGTKEDFLPLILYL